MSKYIKELIEQGENQILDFKFEVSDSKKIARSLVAFANTDGGILLIGVKDNGKIAGVRSEEEYFMLETATQIFCRPEVKFSALEWNIEGKVVYEVKVPKSENRPHFVKSDNNKFLAYIRVEDQNLLANNVLLQVWKREKSNEGILVKYQETQQFLLEYLAENKIITFSRFVKLSKISRRKAEKILVNFLLLNILEIVVTEKITYYKLKSV
ncbi:MAG: ATP-binding protein [Bacteroidetes bacterium]|jgi:predicted HTH transcriptional regulator|nr:ATP-binding protein [Bacteroidota bacterium]MBT6686805.1 ATP-binding protein [Bacteroidota bacterium]MBT7144135.1 ATP-binding protein [Bacteroidota bacterium]MBT7490071.1 ATP-binding protein [Bacteroidota bacterium]